MSGRKRKAFSLICSPASVLCCVILPLSPLASLLFFSLSAVISLCSLLCFVLDRSVFEYSVALSRALLAPHQRLLALASFVLDCLRQCELCSASSSRLAQPSLLLFLQSISALLCILILVFFISFFLLLILCGFGPSDCSVLSALALPGFHCCTRRKSCGASFTRHLLLLRSCYFCFFSFSAELRFVVFCCCCFFLFVRVPLVRAKRKTERKIVCLS